MLFWRFQIQPGRERTRGGGGGGGGGGGSFPIGATMPCKLNFMYVCVCTPVNLYMHLFL